MNFRLIILTVALVLGSLLGHLILQDSGYILISFQSWVFETSLWVFLAILAVLILGGFIFVQVLMGLLRGPSSIRNWREERGIKQAINKTVKGLISLAEGNWKQSEKLLMAGAQGNGKIINYLAAARAAQQAGDYQHSDNLLIEAVKSTKGSELAVGLQQAQLQIERKQYEQSLATCLRLKKTFPKHQYVNHMLLKTYTKLEDWQSVLTLLPVFNKYKLLPSKETIKLEINAYDELIENLVNSRNACSKNSKELLNMWHKIPKRILKQAGFVPLAEKFFGHLICLAEQDEGEPELRQILGFHWSQDLIRQYGCLKGKDSNRQLLFAKDQLKQRPNDAMLLLTLGRLSLLNEQFDEALNYFEASLNQESHIETRSELSRLYLAKNETEKALNMLKIGLGPALPSLPLPQ